MKWMPDLNMRQGLPGVRLLIMFFIGQSGFA